MFSLDHRTIPTALAVAALGLAGAAPGALARHGADDGPGHQRHSGERHDRGHAAGQRRGSHHRGTHRRHGADDGPNHRRHGADDGPNHT
jgi:hypothetical protein